jgi:hypothetical protein
MPVVARRAWAAACAIALAGGAAPASATEGAAAVVVPEPRGAVVVALGDGASAAARPLAFEVYRDAALRPSIDDGTARVLAGEDAPADAPRALLELAELRRSIAPAGTDAASRRALGSLGEDVHARFVVSVAMIEGKPVARVLRVAGAALEWATLTPSASTTAAGSPSTWTWPGAVATLRGLVPSAPLAPVAAATPSPPPADATQPPAAKSPFWKSPWFWVPLGVLVTAGVTVLAVSQTTDTSSSSVHVQGRVAP